MFRPGLRRTLLAEAFEKTPATALEIGRVGRPHLPEPGQEYRHRLSERARSEVVDGVRVPQAQAELEAAVRIDRGGGGRRHAGEDPVAAGPGGAAAKVAPLVDSFVAMAPGEPHELVAAGPQAGDGSVLILFFAPARAQVEEHGEGGRADMSRKPCRPGFERIRFVARRRQNGAFNGEGHSILAEKTEAAAAGGKRAGDARHGFAGLFRQPVDRNLDGLERRHVFEEAGQARRDERGVGEEHHSQAEPSRVEVDLLEVGSEERLAAGQPHDEAAQAGRFRQDAPPTLGGPFERAGFDVACGEVDRAMAAVVVAALGELDVETRQGRLRRLPQTGFARRDFAHIGLGGHGHPAPARNPSRTSTIAPLLSKERS